MRKMIEEWWEVWYDDGLTRIKTGYPGDGKCRSLEDARGFTKKHPSMKYTITHVRRYRLIK